MSTMAELSGVVKLYGSHQALGPLDLRLEGRAAGILGPNGSGKTTMIRLLLGLLPPTAGTVRVLDEELPASAGSVRRRIGYMPEGDALFPDLTGIEAVTFAGRLVGMRRPEAIERSHEVLDYVELGEERYRLVERFSSGMRQRLKLAQALVHDPELLILDEPTEGVDPEARAHIIAMLTDLSRNTGLRLIISTHLLHDLEELADSAIVLNQGRVAARGTLDELRAPVASAYVVRVNGDPTALTALLDTQGVTWESTGDAVKVMEADPHAVLRRVKEAGLVVRHMAPAQLSLEEAFEAAVGVSAVE